MESRFLLDVVIRQGTTVFELLASKDETLLVWWDPLLVLNFALDIVDGIARLDFESDGFTSDYATNMSVAAQVATGARLKGGLKLTGLDEDLHDCG